MTTAADRTDALAERRFDATLGALEPASDWLPAMPDVLARLESARHARIADVGCGHGFLDARARRRVPGRPR
jgi:hypothetical protein